MFGRRLLILVAVLMGLTALAASVAPVPQRPAPGTSPRATATATATPSASAGTETTGRVVTARFDADAQHAAVVVAHTGDLVAIDVTGRTVDTVTIDALAQEEPIAPGSPAHFDTYADTPGTFPIRLLESGRQVGVLRVSGRPAPG